MRARDDLAEMLCKKETTRPSSQAHCPFRAHLVCPPCRIGGGAGRPRRAAHQPRALSMTEGQSITTMAITRAMPMSSVVIAWGENKPLLNKRLSFWWAAEAVLT